MTNGARSVNRVQTRSVNRVRSVGAERACSVGALVDELVQFRSEIPSVGHADTFVIPSHIDKCYTIFFIWEIIEFLNHAWNIRQCTQTVGNSNWDKLTLQELTGW